MIFFVNKPEIDIQKDFSKIVFNFFKYKKIFELTLYKLSMILCS